MRGGVLASAEGLPDGWENGIQFRTSGCSTPEVMSPCVVTDTQGERPGLAEFRSIFIRQTAACATMSQVGTVNLAANRLEATTEWALGRVLATGADTGNPSFLDAERVHASATADVVAAVSCLESAAAELGAGTEVILHAPVRAAAYLRNASLIDDLGLSPAGFLWVISPGYPVATDSDDEQTVSIWATGTLWAGVSVSYPIVDPNTGRQPIGWRTNDDTAFAQRMGLAAFDPCLNLTASFVVPPCIGGS